VKPTDAMARTAEVISPKPTEARNRLTGALLPPAQGSPLRGALSLVRT
jgi:hypothetical protein